MKIYRSLQDVYRNIGQKVAPIPRQTINEWTISASDEGAAPIKLGDVDEKFYNRLRKDIVNYQGGVADLLKKLIDDGHWDRGMKYQDYSNKILLPAQEAFKSELVDQTDVNLLKQLLKNKENLTGFGDQIRNAADNNTSFNYLDSLEAIAAPIFQGDIRGLLDRLYAIDFQQSNVNVGKGELVATLFSNAVKGKKGDLYIDGLGEVEIKGTSGRPGKSGGPLMGSREKLPEMLDDRGHDIYTGKEIQKFLLNLTRSINELRSYISSLMDNPRFADAQENLSQISARIEQLTDPDTIKNIIPRVFYKEVEDLEILIHGSGLPSTQVKTALSKLNLGSNSKPGLEKTFKEFDHSKDRKTIDPGDKEKYHWSDIVKHYFLGDQWGLKKDDIVAGFVELANEALDPQDISQLRQALDVIVDDELMAALKAGDKTVLDTVVATIHSASYQHKEEFPIMLLVNSETKNAYPLAYPGENFREKILNHYDTINHLISNGLLKIGLSVDPRSKGVQFTFTG